MDTELRIFNYQTTEYNKALELRYRVLRKPLGLEFTKAELQKDTEDVHFGLFNGEIIVACLTLTKTKNNRMKMRQVAVDENYHGKGMGREISEFAETYAKENGFNTMFCNARKVAVPFYEKLGYKIVSDEFSEVNIPHYTMEKQL